MLSAPLPATATTSAQSKSATTAPSSPFLSVSEEMARLRPALKSVRREFPDAVLSIDTFYSDVAAMASEEFGVDIINDISGGQIDERMFNTVARLNLPYILMHMRGTPQTMQSLTQYENFLQDILFIFLKNDFFKSVGSE